MKALITLLFALCLWPYSPFSQVTTAFHVGYSSQSSNLKPVTGFKVSYRYTLYKDESKAEEASFHPIAEINELGHLDQDANHIIIGSLGAGIIWKQNISFTAGLVYGGNQVKQDRHVYQDTTIYLQHGNSSDHFTGTQFSLNGMINLRYNEYRQPWLQLFTQATLIHKKSAYDQNIFFGTIGIRILYNKSSR